MPQIWFASVPFSKEHVTLALESGVDGVIVPADHVEAVSALGRVTVLSPEQAGLMPLNAKEDEELAVERLLGGSMVTLAEGWEVIPIENILARSRDIFVEAASIERARLAAGIMQHGVKGIVVLPEAIADLKTVIAELKLSQGRIDLQPAVVTEVTPVGLGHRVCVDTLSMLKKGQGMLVGNSSAFTFLVHAETEDNPYVAARPFRVNAGAVHAYAAMPGDRTAYLEELSSGREVLIVDHEGQTGIAVIGRTKVEVRPMLLVRARIGEGPGAAEGAVFLQNAETIRLTTPGGEPVSVVGLQPGDTVLCRTDAAGRHFGMRVSEEIEEG